MSKDDALHSLYGKGHLNATRTRECVAMPGTRDQRICTPPCVVERLHWFWDGPPAYDPSHCEGSIVGALEYTSTRGLIDPWPDKTFYNPPYGDSLFDPENESEAYAWELLVREARKFGKEWNKTDRSERLEKFGRGVPEAFWDIYPERMHPDVDLDLPRAPKPIKKAGLGDWLAMHHHYRRDGREIIGLVPNRTNRRWLRAWRSICDALVELDPLKFLVEDRKNGGWVEAKSAFPAPLVLGYTGPSPEDFEEIFGDLGDPV